MSEKDLKNFIKKVDDLNKMLKSIKEQPKRRAQLVKCSTHSEVIELARKWGYEIDKRWGEKI